MLPAAIGLLIVSGYVLGLWWLLRREGPWAFAGLAALCGISLSLRLVYTTDYPAGLNEDEPKNLACTLEAVEYEQPFHESCNGPPYLLSYLFAAPLVPYLGFSRWSMRTYSLITGVLATPAAYAVARGMGLRLSSSLLAAGLISVLPWSIFYGRITLGGELIFHELLLLAGLARLIWSAGGWPDALLSAFGLCLLLWDYLVGKSMMGMPVLTALLTRGFRRRLWALAVVPLALLGWYQHLRTGPKLAAVGLSASTMNPGLSAALWDTFVQRTEWTLWTFLWPVAQDNLFTMRSVAIHPLFLLVLAAAGVFTGVRRGLFLLAGFAAGLMPGIVSGLVPGAVSGGLGISTHRTMMAFPFVALAAACAVDVLPWRRLRAATATVVLVVAGVWSVTFYFSPRFWGYGEDRFTYDVERTQLTEAVAANPPAHLIAMYQIGYYVPRVPGMQVDFLNVDNWLPADGQAVTYLFTPHMGLLRAQYERLFPGRVRPIGRRSFLVDFDATDRSWLHQYGWSYTVTCDARVHTAHVPFLFSSALGVSGMRCQGPLRHVWRAHWLGPRTEMALFFTGVATIETRGVSLQLQGFERRAPFTMAADADVTITVSLPPSEPWPLAVLMEVSPGGDRVPDWDRFTPLSAPEPAVAASDGAAPPP